MEDDTIMDGNSELELIANERDIAQALECTTGASRPKARAGKLCYDEKMQCGLCLA